MPLPITKIHAEWLSLLEISGPFLSMPVLTAAFPQGLDNLDDGQARSLRADYDYWKENSDNPAIHTAWVRLVLESLLGYASEGALGAVGAQGPVPLRIGQSIPSGWKADFPEHEETLRPDMMLVDPGSPTNAPHLFIQVYPPSQSLEKAVQGSRWQASAATRMMELLHATEVRLGLLTNGEQWMLVYAPRGETSGFSTWYAELWFDEQVTLRAFKSLLGVQRFFGVAAGQTLESLLKQSANDQQEITDQLGLQVRHAVEILIQKIDQADQDSGGKLLGKDVPPALLYEAALTVMMRLVFMLSAEERKLLPLDDSLYAENYAVSTLYAQLSVTEEEVLERRFDAWSRLLAVFRAVYSGIYHDRLNLLPYGGSLFDPDKYPFLEGRQTNGPRTSAEKRGEDQEHLGESQNALTQASTKDLKQEKGFIRVPPRSSAANIPLPVNNRTVLHLLKALQILQIEGEARRISFRALDVEQIGHVYEGLLDHIAVRSTELILGLRGAKRQEPEIALSTLEAAFKKKEPDWLAWLKTETGRSETALRNVLAQDTLQKDPEQANRLRATIGNDARLFARLAPFAGLIRADDFDIPVIILPGSVYVTSGSTRRATGTHYTPRSLTEPVVQHTLEPLVYYGPAEGLPREQWRLKSPAELLALKICDMAMGSGGFLVQVVRYLAERLVEAWELYPEPFAADGRGPLRARKDQENFIQEPLNKKEGFIRVPPRSSAANLESSDPLILARRMVAERCIYGVDKNPLAVEIAKLSLWLVTMAKDLPFSFLDHALKCGDSLVGCSEDDFLRWAHGYKAATMTLFDEQIRTQLQTARAKRRELESFIVNDAQDAQRKAELLEEADTAMAHIQRGADLLTGTRLLGLKTQEIEDLQINLLIPYMAGELDNDNSPLLTGEGLGVRCLRAAQKERAFHWEFAFPEVFEKGGFSAFVGNPPFIGGRRIRENLGGFYRDYLDTNFIGSSGNADLSAFFFLQTYHKLRKSGVIGLIATNTIAQGDTRETGLEKIVSLGGLIFNATNNMPWPGQAAVAVSVIHIYKGDFAPPFVLDDIAVENISSLLEGGSTHGKLQKLLANKEKSFQGSVIVGMGFVLTSEAASDLIKRNPKNSDVLFLYLNGEDINTNPDQSPSRWIINFSDWKLEKSEQYSEPMAIIREKVYPVRMNVSREAHRKYWWHYGDKRPALYGIIATQTRVLVRSQVSKYHAFVWQSKDKVFDQRLVIFTYENSCYFSLLQSTIHEVWGRKYSATLETRQSYTPTDCFETFPFPQNLSGLELIGETYHETRRQIMLARQEGLTKTYNRFHNPDEHSADIQQLRELHVQMDTAVAAAYGWEDLALGHDFHETAQGVRYTISESARREVLSRLLKLNHERYAEEQLQGAGEVKIKKGAGPRTAADPAKTSGLGKRGGDQKKNKVAEKPDQYGLF